MLCPINPQRRPGPLLRGASTATLTASCAVRWRLHDGPTIPRDTFRDRAPTLNDTASAGPRGADARMLRKPATRKRSARGAIAERGPSARSPVPRGPQMPAHRHSPQCLGSVDRVDRDLAVRPCRAPGHESVLGADRARRALQKLPPASTVGRQGPSSDRPGHGPAAGHSCFAREYRNARPKMKATKPVAPMANRVPPRHPEPAQGQHQALAGGSRCCGNTSSRA